jgi:hypothetical protein
MSQDKTAQLKKNRLIALEERPNGSRRLSARRRHKDCIPRNDGERRDSAEDVKSDKRSLALRHEDDIGRNILAPLLLAKDAIAASCVSAYPALRGARAVSI